MRTARSSSRSCSPASRCPRAFRTAAFKPDVSTEGFQWLRDERRPAHAAPDGDPGAWNALQLPPGFRMTVRSAQMLPGSAEPVDHLVFTDGWPPCPCLSKCSTSRAAGPGAAPAAVAEAAAVGSSSAFSTVVDGHKVTAVGEVPPATVQFIATR